VSLLKLKPTRREILQLLQQALYRRRQAQIDEITRQIQAIDTALKEREKAWEKEVAELQNAAPGTDTQVKLIRKHAQKLGLQETSYVDNRQVLHVEFRTAVEIDLKGLKFKPRPELTEAQKKRRQELNQQVHKLAHRHIDDSCLVAHLVDGNDELLKEIDSVAAKIADSVENGSTKLLEGSVD
jgi:hypothetical protein